MSNDFLCVVLINVSVIFFVCFCYTFYAHSYMLTRLNRNSFKNIWHIISINLRWFSSIKNTHTHMYITLTYYIYTHERTLTLFYKKNWPISPLPPCKFFRLIFQNDWHNDVDDFERGVMPSSTYICCNCWPTSEEPDIVYYCK